MKAKEVIIMNVNEYINRKINNYDDRSKDLILIVDEEYFFYLHTMTMTMSTLI